MAVITTNESIDYNVLTTDRGSSNATVVRPAADSTFANLDNHIPDDLGGYIGKNGTTTRGGNVPDTLAGESLTPDREILQSDHRKAVIGTGNYVQVMDEVNTDYAEGFGGHIFDSSLNHDAKEYTISATSIAALRTALIQFGDTRWTSDKKLGRKDMNQKYQYIEKFTDNGVVKFRLKLSNCVSDAVAMTMASPSKIKIHTSQELDLV